MFDLCGAVCSGGDTGLAPAHCWPTFIPTTALKYAVTSWASSWQSLSHYLATFAKTLRPWSRHSWLHVDLSGPRLRDKMISSRTIIREAWKVPLKRYETIYLQNKWADWGAHKYWSVFDCPGSMSNVTVTFPSWECLTASQTGCGWSSVDSPWLQSCVFIPDYRMKMHWCMSHVTAAECSLKSIK